MGKKLSGVWAKSPQGEVLHFESVSAAAKHFYSSTSGIWNAISKKTGYGYAWARTEEELPEVVNVCKIQKHHRPVHNSKGEMFTCVKEAAKAYGVDRNYIYRAINKGTCSRRLRWAYIDTPLEYKKTFDCAANGTRYKPVFLLDGTEFRRFESVAEAAEVVSVSKTAIYTAISSGVRAGGYYWVWEDSAS